VIASDAPVLETSKLAKIALDICPKAIATAGKTLDSDASLEGLESKNSVLRSVGYRKLKYGDLFVTFAPKGEVFPKSICIVGDGTKKTETQTSSYVLFWRALGTLVDDTFDDARIVKGKSWSSGPLRFKKPDIKQTFALLMQYKPATKKETDRYSVVVAEARERR